MDLVLDALDAVEDDGAVASLDVEEAVEGGVHGGAAEERHLEQRRRTPRSRDIGCPNVPKVHRPPLLFPPCLKTTTLKTLEKHGDDGGLSSNGDRREGWSD